MQWHTEISSVLISYSTPSLIILCLLVRWSLMSRVQQSNACICTFPGEALPASLSALHLLHPPPSSLLALRLYFIITATIITLFWVIPRVWSCLPSSLKPSNALLSVWGEMRVFPGCLFCRRHQGLRIYCCNSLFTKTHPSSCAHVHTHTHI